MAGATINTGTSRVAGQLSGDANGNTFVTLPSTPSQSGYDRTLVEVDGGGYTGIVDLKAPELDSDYRLRVAPDTLLEEEVFSYTAQNTGKHTVATTTQTVAFAAGGVTLNNSAIVTATTGSQIATYAAFPYFGTMTLSCDAQISFSAQPNANTFVEWGMGVPGGATAAPTDGVFFRLNSAGLQGIASYNGAEVSTGVFPLANGSGVWSYVNNRRYQFIVYLATVEAVFWVADFGSTATDTPVQAIKLGSIPLPAGQARLCLATGLQFFAKQRITGGAGGAALQAVLGAYNIRSGGGNFSSQIGETGNRVFGSYQGLSGGTMGGLATYVNSTNPTAAAPSNTALTANLPGGLGGQGAVTAAAAAATDGIWSSYQVPAVSVNAPARRLKIVGVRIDAVNMGAAVATTATTIQFALAFGHTAVSLATAEGAAAKAPRRVPLGIMNWAIGAAIGAQPDKGFIGISFREAPIYVNPGEFVALVGKFLNGTATASQVINFTYTPVYAWE